MTGNVIQPNGANNRTVYVFNTDDLETFSSNIISHINEITPDSYILIGSDMSNYLTFRITQFINTTNDKRLTFSACMWNGIWTFVASSNTSDVGLVQMNAGTNSDYTFTGSIQAGSGLIKSWWGNKYLII